jgi:hypothetical protein
MNIYTEGKAVASQQSVKATNQHRTSQHARESVLLSNIAYWVEKNSKAGIHRHGGKYWTYLSRKKIHEKYPYLSEAMVRATLESLERQGLILKGHFGVKEAYSGLKNNTCSYTLTEKAEGLYKNRTFHGEGARAAQGELDLDAPKEQRMWKKENEKDADAAPIGAVPAAFPTADTVDEVLKMAFQPAYAQSAAPAAAWQKPGKEAQQPEVIRFTAGQAGNGDAREGQAPKGERKAGVVDYILLAVGVGCLLMSIRNSWLYLTGAGFTPAGAFITAVITACFTAVAFAIKGAPIKALACLVVGFSVFATFSVYYAHYEREAGRTAGYEAARTDYAGKQEEARRALEVLRERVTVLTAEADYWRDKSWNRYDGLQTSLKEVYTQEQTLNEYLLQSDAPVADTATGAVFAGFPALAGLLGITPELLRLLVFLIPAVFFDVASPLLFANYFKRQGG